MIKRNGQSDTRPECHECGNLICGNDYYHLNVNRPICGNCIMKEAEHRQHINIIRGFAWEIVNANADIARATNTSRMEKSSMEYSFAALTTLLAMPTKSANKAEK